LVTKGKEKKKRKNLKRLMPNKRDAQRMLYLKSTLISPNF